MFPFTFLTANQLFRMARNGAKMKSKYLRNIDSSWNARRSPAHRLAYHHRRPGPGTIEARRVKNAVPGGPATAVCRLTFGRPGSEKRMRAVSVREARQPAARRP